MYPLVPFLSKLAQKFMPLKFEKYSTTKTQLGINLSDPSLMAKDGKAKRRRNACEGNLGFGSTLSATRLLLFLF